MANITVVGLGPGRPGLITRESWQLLNSKATVVLRTSVHPTVAALREAGITFESYDSFYERATDFDALYDEIAGDLLRRAAQGEELVYAVPGSPLVAERTVVRLRELACTSEVEVTILPGMSFVEVLYTRLGIDPIAGLTIMDAADAASLAARPAQSLVITQPYSQEVASECKLALMELYGDEYEVIYIHGLALPEESLRRLPLYELDRQPDLDHLTSVFVPAGAFSLPEED